MKEVIKARRRKHGWRERQRALKAQKCSRKWRRGGTKGASRHVYVGLRWSIPTGRAAISASPEEHCHLSDLAAITK